MCGISGILKSCGSIDEKLLLKANETMRHRGPDASSTWLSVDKTIGFGHIRLSIVDLDPRSTQPFTIDDGNYTIVFNGEIYNYRTLRKELEDNYNVVFRTTSDTEVLIQLYKNIGENCLRMLEGMFAFVIYDKKKNISLVARDFVGQKPLVYICDETGFYFASEIPGLLSLYPDFKRELDIESLKFYMMDNYTHLPHTCSIFKNIHKLAPGSMMIIQDGKIIKHELYEHLEKVPQKTEKSEIAFLEETLDEMRPTDVGYASFLSGGIDSSFVCSVLKSYETSPTEAYTLRISSDDEDFKRSQLVVDTLDLEHNVIDIEGYDYQKGIDETISLLGEPYFHITSLYADKILSEASKKHRVFFTGAGGDECYYGYDNLLFILMDIYFTLERFLPRRLINLIDFLTKKRYTSILSSNAKNFKEHYYQENYHKISRIFLDKTPIDERIQKTTQFFEDFIKAENYIDRSYMYGLFLENMHSLTIQGDLIGMKHSIEIRSLFLEKRVIKRSFSLPLSTKVSLSRLREGKELLRKQLLKIFPKSFIYAKKIGFGVKFDFKNEILVNMGTHIHDTLQKLEESKLFDMQEIETLFRDFRGNFHTIMKLYAFQIWREKFLP